MRRRSLPILLALCIALALLPTVQAADLSEPGIRREPIGYDGVGEVFYDDFDAWLMQEAEVRPMSVEDGTVDLKPANEVRWIDRVELPDYALRLYEVLEEAVDGDGYNDYLIDDEYYDLEGENVRTDVPGGFMRGTVYNSSDDSTTRYTAVLLTTTETADTDQNTKDYVTNCIYTVLSAFKFDHQEVFWINGRGVVRFSRNDGKTYYGLSLCTRRSSQEGETISYYEIRRPDFRSDGLWDIRGAMARRDGDIEKILGTIPAGADRFSQIFYLNKWLAENNQYNTSVKYDGDGPWYAYEGISALEGLDGEYGPVCSGYAAAFKMLCDGLGIPCVTVTGRVSENTGHRWNYVQLEDGKWYAVDVTYDDRNDDGANLTKWLLVGGKTVVNGKEFLDTHPAHNRSYYSGGTDFTNGPVLSDEACPRGVRLAYRGFPEALSAGTSVTMTPALIFDSGAEYTYSSTTLPAGLSLDPDTGEITGTATAPVDSLTVTVTAVNPSDPTDRAECTLTFSISANYAIDYDRGSGKYTITSAPPAGDVFVAAALYDSGGKLLEAKLERLTIEGASADGVLRFDSVPASSDYIKVFLLDQSCTPLCTAFEEE